MKRIEIAEALLLMSKTDAFSNKMIKSLLIMAADELSMADNEINALKEEAALNRGFYQRKLMAARLHNRENAVSHIDNYAAPHLMED